MKKLLLLPLIILLFLIIGNNVYSQEDKSDYRLDFSEYKILKKENSLVVYFDISGIKDTDHKNQIITALKDMQDVTFVRIYKSSSNTDHCQLKSTNVNLIPEEIRQVLKENDADFNFTSVKRIKKH